MATAPIQVAAAALGGLVLSRLGRNDPSGWGDLVGAITGIMLGAGVGLGVILVLTARALGTPWAHTAPLGLLAVPSALLVIAPAGMLGIGYPLAAPLYLVACTWLVWRYAGRQERLGAAG